MKEREREREREREVQLKLSLVTLDDASDKTKFFSRTSVSMQREELLNNRLASTDHIEEKTNENKQAEQQI